MFPQGWAHCALDLKKQAYSGAGDAVFKGSGALGPQDWKKAPLSWGPGVLEPLKIISAGQLYVWFSDILSIWGFQDQEVSPWSQGPCAPGMSENCMQNKAAYAFFTSLNMLGPWNWEEAPWLQGPGTPEPIKNKSTSQLHIQFLKPIAINFHWEFWLTHTRTPRSRTSSSISGSLCAGDNLKISSRDARHQRLWVNEFYYSIKLTCSRGLSCIPFTCRGWHSNTRLDKKR